jgi:hypothetical protein
VIDPVDGDHDPGDYADQEGEQGDNNRHPSEASASTAEVDLVDWREGERLCFLPSFCAELRVLCTF